MMTLTRLWKTGTANLLRHERPIGPPPPVRRTARKSSAVRRHASMIRVLFAVALLLASGCGEDEAAPPITSVRWVAPRDREEISNVVPLQLDAVAVEEVRYELGDQILFTRPAPNLDVQWNSRLVPNGLYDLRVIAVGHDNNDADVIKVIVNNIGLGPLGVFIDPTEIVLPLRGTTQFLAWVVGVQNRGIEWSVRGGDAFGTIDDSGLYTAPSVRPEPPKASVVARSALNSEVTAEATVRFR